MTSNYEQTNLPQNEELTQASTLNSILEPIRRKYNLPAMAAAIVTSNSTIALGAIGERKCGSKVPVTVNDQFHLGSCTKAMTATLIGILVEQGKLSWNTTIVESFPELGARLIPDYHNVTLSQILSHRAGFAGSQRTFPKGKTFWDIHKLPGSPRQQRLAYVEMALRLEPTIMPGQFLYSNMGYAVAGAIAEKATNESWEDLITQMIFQPLGMTTAGFGAMGTPGQIDQPWQHINIWFWRQAIEPGLRSDNPPAIAAAGTVHSSIGDWGKFIAMHLKGEQNQPGLLKPETIKKLHTPPNGGDYALGWAVVERSWGGGRVLTHSGSNNMNFSVVWVAPLRDFAVLVVTNQGGNKAAKACDDAVGALLNFYENKNQYSNPI